MNRGLHAYNFFKKLYLRPLDKWLGGLWPLSQVPLYYVTFLYTFIHTQLEIPPETLSVTDMSYLKLPNTQMVSSGDRRLSQVSSVRKPAAPARLTHKTVHVRSTKYTKHSHYVFSKLLTSYWQTHYQ